MSLCINNFYGGVELNILLAKTAGFCFGVDRAVNSVYESVKKYKMPVYTLGPIIHNNEVVQDLSNKGVKTIQDLNEFVDNDAVLIIRSHGVSSEVYDKIKSNNILSVDMTCPYVKKIHRIVKEHCENGYKIIIVGDKNHPEVIGINGWCNNSAVIVNSLEECYVLEKYDKICIVAQTTFSIEKWEEIKNFLIHNKCNEYVEFNTICSATSERQREAAEIAKKVDVMIIIGGKHSSNTQKLYNICEQYCKNCHHIETVNDLNLDKIKKYENIGITAGASTPNWVINTVVDMLNNIDNNEKADINLSLNTQNNNEELNDNQYDDFIEALDKSLKSFKIGDIVTGQIMSINNEEIIISLGYKSDGIIPISEFTNDQDNIEQILNNYKTGDTIDAVIIDNDQEGNIILSKKEADEKIGWEKAKSAYDNNSIILVKVLKETKGGFIGLFESLRVFIPFSQISDKYVKDAGEFISTIIPAKIIEFNEEKGNVVASSRVVLEENKQRDKKDFWDSIYIGKAFVGKVKKISNYGAFIDLGNVDGLLHISEITWSKQEPIENIINIDDDVEVYIKEFDREQSKIMLGLKNRPQSPWTKIENKYSTGDIIDAKVVRLVSFGAFLELEPGIEGLVHISEISDRRISKPEEVLEIGQNVKAKINSIDYTNRKLSLSIKDVAPINLRGESNTEINEHPAYSEDLNVTISDLIKIKKLKK